MLGRIKWGKEPKIKSEWGMLHTLPVLTVTLPQGAKKRMWQKCAQILVRYRVTRVLTPRDFNDWPFLMQYGLRPVDTRGLRCALAESWTRAALCTLGITPEQAVLRLSGECVSADMVNVARKVSLLVRNLVIDVPGGEALAAALRREYGLPVLPGGSSQTDLTLAFCGGPVLAGARLSLLCGEKMPDDIEMLSTFSILWENRLIKTQDIAIKVDFS